MGFPFNTNEKQLKMAGRIAFCLLAVLAIAMALATFAERNHGTDYAMLHYYHAPWFIALWGGLILFGLLGLLAKKRTWKIWLLHLSLVLILAGAGLTHFTGKTGQLHLRIDRPTRLYADSEHKGRVEHLPFDVTLKKFKAQNDDYASIVEIAGKIDSIRLNRPLRKGGVQFTQFSYDPDLQGSRLGVTIDPFGRWTSIAGYTLLFISIALLLPSTSINIIAICLCLHCIFFLLYANCLPPILRYAGGYFLGHVSLIILSYLCFLGTLICSVLYLFFPTKKTSTHSRRFLHYGVYLLAAGIFVGAIWGEAAWGRYWAWDAKETWALITLFTYLAPLHAGSLTFFKNNAAYHIYMLLAFLILLMTFIGVNFLFTGLHSYL